LLHIREGGLSEVKIAQRSQTQLDHTKTQAKSLPIWRPFKKAAVEQGHDDAMGRCFVQTCGPRNLGYTSFGVLTVKG
jgi:hypothetical protein